MTFLNYYDKLAVQDVKKVEENIIQWSKDNPNGVLLIDESTLWNLRSRLIEQTGRPQPTVTSLYMDTITISWTKVGDEKTILNIVQEYGGKILYTQPKTWKECELWYQFK